MKRLVFLGPPGAGKGTFAQMMVEALAYTHISTGDILRAEIAAATPLGKEARKHVESGGLVPDEIIAGVVQVRLERTDLADGGFILDGFPRTLPQAGLLEGVLDRRGWKLDATVLFDTDRDLLVRRLTARRLCRKCGAGYNVLYSPPTKDGVCDKCGGELYQRADDSRETALDRLQVYDRQTAPLVELYRRRGLLREVDSGGTKADVFLRLRALLEL
jgi:adenylate kinase